MKRIQRVYEFLYRELCENSFIEKNPIHTDIKSLMTNQRQFIANDRFKGIIDLMEEKAELEIDDDYLEKLYESDLETFFFPENDVKTDTETVDKIRSMRMVEKTSEGESKITNPYEEILITSNVLLTLPKNIENLTFSEKDKIDMSEEQENWYDHPIPLDIEEQSNEIIYGLKNLSESLRIETDCSVNVLLSVSTTHSSLNKIAKKYIEDKIKTTNVDNLNIYVMTEFECNMIMNIIDSNNKELQETIGVDGKYGRHYSFLKAIAPLFRDCADSKIKGTFKIDLDQVFPQEKLHSVTGKYAFDFFCSKKWDSTGYDKKNRKVRLGMIAGGLVNDSDIHLDLIWPDVKKPSDFLTIEQYIFNSQRPQYTSTVAEICKIYDNDNESMMRFHVTGGTNGILLESLEKFRPFTPSFVTRAEDQAYIMSVYNKEVEGEYLRYVHLDRFMMRHDKESFLTDDLKVFAIPKSVGDFERILIFSHYAFDILKIGKELKEELYPFTSVFIVERPYITILLRMLTKLLMLNQDDGNKFLESFIPRISKLIKQVESGELKNKFYKEKKAYDYYYDRIKEGLSNEQVEKIKRIFFDSRIITKKLY